MRFRLAMIILFVCAVVCAQEFRARITGQVTDPSGAGVPGAAVEAINVDTRLGVKTTTSVDGHYALAEVPVGRYSVTCEAAGFKKFARGGVSLSVGDRATIDIRLEVGAMTENVTVTAELAVTDTDRSVLSQLMDNKGVTELPLNGRQIFMLMQMSSGTIFTQQEFGASGFSGTRAWDTNGSQTIHGGLTSSNQFNVDGASINAGTGEWKFAPLVDGIQEFTVAAPSSDASLGLTGGGTLNMTMKSGSNDLHGTFSEYVRNNIFDANYTQGNRAGSHAMQHQWNDFSALMSGPIRKNKLFFSSWYEGFRERIPFSVTQSVPSELERVGDFSNTRNASGALVTIFDPASTVASGSGYARTPFSDNKLPASSVSAISKNIMAFIPHPNNPGNPFTQANNFIASPNVGRYGYNAWYSKFDYLWNDSNRTSGSVSQNWGFEYRSNNGIQDNPGWSGNDPLRRVNYASTLDHVWTVNPTTVVDIRAAWQRYINYGSQELAEKFDGSQLGWTVPIGSAGVTHFPRIELQGNYSFIMANGGYSSNRVFQPDQAYTLNADLSKTKGRHLIRFGTRISDVRPNRYNSGWTYGNFVFNNAFTQRNPQTADTTSGNAVASFLLGDVASGNTDINAQGSPRYHTYGLYVQDNLRLTPKLSLNLGLRWDLQTPGTEVWNRHIVGFDSTTSYTLGSASAKGGLIFASPAKRSYWDAKYTGFQPRLGLAYAIKPRLVLRAGYGLSYLPLGGPGDMRGLREPGYSLSTAYVATSGGGVNQYIPNLPGNSTWQNPFPVILQPYGNSRGLKTLAGQTIQYDNNSFVVPRVHQFNLGFEYEVPRTKTTLEASYVGSRTRKLPLTLDMNFIPADLRTQCITTNSLCNGSATNPFAGAPELTGFALFNATTTAEQLAKPYPQFTGVNMSNSPIGSQTGDLLEVRANKRVGSGLMFNVSYTLSKIYLTRGRREPQYTTLFRTLAEYDRTQHVGLILQYDLPFGKGKRWASGAAGAADKIIGGWQYNTSLEWMTGTPTPRPDAYNLINPALPGGQAYEGAWFNTCTLLANGTRANCASATDPVVWVQKKPYQFMTYDDRFPNIRNMWATQVNMSVFKNVKVGERVAVQLRGEAFNIFNTPIYKAPDTSSLTSSTFGRTIISQQNFPRFLQFALRLSF